MAGSEGEERLVNISHLKYYSASNHPFPKLLFLIMRENIQPLSGEEGGFCLCDAELKNSQKLK